VSDTIEVDDADPTSLKVLNGHALASMPKTAELLDCGLSRVYKLLDEGELKSFLVGGRRKVAVADIADFIARKRAEEPKKRVVPWDRNVLGARQYHLRREDPERVAKPEKPPLRPVGRPRTVKG
jgi:excisionase family DNA binding protein